MNKLKDLKVKIILLGGEGVGKTTILRKFAKIDNHSDDECKFGIDFIAKKVSIQSINTEV